MVKITYIGDISPMNIKVNGSSIKNWNKDETKDLDEVSANILLAQTDKFVSQKEKKEEKKSFKKDYTFEEDE